MNYIELKKLSAAERMEKALKLREQLFELANSFSGNETGNAAVMLHESCNWVIRANNYLKETGHIT